MPLISIVIPCYNAENYVDHCMQTVTNQTIGIENLEIILVNDGSSDHTLEKLQKWEQRFPSQITIISYEQNMRQGTAKNIGIQYATADYIGFVDIDDWIEENMYELLYEKAKEHSYDVVRGKYTHSNQFNDGQIVNNNPRNDQHYECPQKGGFYIHSYTDKGNNGQFGFLPTGIYKKSIITDNDIQFPEGLSYEDNYWGSLFFYYAKNIYIVDQIVYHYFTNLNSTTTGRNSPRHFDRLEIEMLKLEAYKKRGIYQVFHDEIEWDFIQMFWLNSLYIFFTRFDKVPQIVNDMRKIVLKNFPDYKKNPKYKENFIVNMILLSALDAPMETFSDIDLAVMCSSYLGSCNALNNLLKS